MNKYVVVKNWDNYISLDEDDFGDLETYSVVFKKIRSFKHRTMKSDEKYYGGFEKFFEKDFSLIESINGNRYIVSDENIISNIDTFERELEALNKEVDMLERELKNKKQELKLKTNKIEGIIDDCDNKFDPLSKFNLPKGSIIKLAEKKSYEKDIFIVEKTIKGKGTFDYFKYKVCGIDELIPSHMLDIEKTIELNKC